jgi:hypothetical protein
MTRLASLLVQAERAVLVLLWDREVTRRRRRILAEDRPADELIDRLRAQAHQAGLRFYEPGQ